MIEKAPEMSSLQEASPPSYASASTSTPLTQTRSAVVSPPSQIVPSDVQLGKDYQAALFARCAQGMHQSERQYGLCGTITAIILFPIGLVCLYLDSKKKCSRCGVLV